MDNNIIKYDAFISYKHSETDKYVAELLHKQLETYVAPNSVFKKTGKKKIKRVFRDKDELPISSNLSDNIQLALTNSEFLIVICTPRTPLSYWVQKEIETFIALHGRSKVLAILVEGEPVDAFPEILQKETVEITDVNGNTTLVNRPVEPLAADIRGGSNKEIGKNLKRELMRIAAPLLHCTYDDLRQRHRERRIKKILYFSLLCSIFFILFGGFSFYQTVKIKQNYRTKLINQSRYLADTSGSLLADGDRMDAIMVALEALPNKAQPNRPYVAKALYALNNALYSYHTASEFVADRSLEHNYYVNDAYFSPTGKTLLTTDGGSDVYLWDVYNGKLINNLSSINDKDDDSRFYTTRILDDDRIIACTRSSLICYNFRNNEVIWSYEFENGIISDFILSKDLTRATVYTATTFTIFDINDGSIISSYVSDDSTIISDVISFSPDNNLLCVLISKSLLSLDSYDINDTNYQLMIYNIMNHNTNLLPIYSNLIPKAVFINNEQLVFSSNDNYMLDNLYGEATNDITLYDVVSNEIVWTTTYSSVTTLSGKSLQFGLVYLDEESNEADYIVYTANNTVTMISKDTGEILYEYTLSSTIEDFTILNGSGFTVLAQGNGIISFMDLVNGINYYDYDIQLAYQVNGAKLSNGTLAVIPYKSNKIVLYKYLAGAGYTIIDTFEDSVASAKYSTNGSNFVLGMNGSDSSYRLQIYDNKTKLYLGDYTTDEGIMFYDFTPDNNLLVCTNNGDISLINPGTQNVIISSQYGEEYNLNYCLNNDHSLLVLTYMDSYIIYNTSDLSVKIDGTIEDRIKYCSISNDGKYFIACVENNTLKIIDTTDNAEISLDKRYILSNSFNHTSLATGRSSNLLAACVNDNTVRVFDLDSKKLLNTIELPTMNQHNLTFSPNDSILLLQGDDGIFKAYDIRASKSIKETQTSLENIIEWKFYDNLDILTGSSINYTYLFTTVNNEYERIADIPRCLDIDPNNKEVLVKFVDELGYFPYYDLDQLIKEGSTVTTGESLSSSDRLRYYID